MVVNQMFVSDVQLALIALMDVNAILVHLELGHQILVREVAASHLAMRLQDYKKFTYHLE